MSTPPSLNDILSPPRWRLTKKIFSPQAFGVSVGSIEFEGQDGSISPEIDTLTNILLRTVTTLASQAGVKNVCIHFDELDQGLSQLDEARKQMIIGLVLAIRSIRSRREGEVIYPVCYIRTDIWDELRFSDKNKISESSAVYLEWDQDSLLEMINERIRAKLGPNFSWSDIEDGNLIRGSQSKWSHIVSRTFMRPRDVIQFLNFATRKALTEMPDADGFDNNDIQSAREPYSRYLKQELDDEIGPHWEKWGDALQACSELATITFTRDAFREVYDKRRSPKNPYDADEALEVLYSFSVIGYRRGIGKGGSGWVFQYSDPDAGWDNVANRLKVHLGLKEFLKLREERIS